MNKIKSFMQTAPLGTRSSIGLLLVRLVMGSAFVLHGWGKIQNPMGWMGPEAPVPGIFQFLAALSEFGGGIALILGLVVMLGTLGIAFTMLVAVLTHLAVMKDPFVNPTGGHSYEIALVYFSISILILCVGPGRYSLDTKVFGTRK